MQRCSGETSACWCSDHSSCGEAEAAKQTLCGLWIHRELRGGGARRGAVCLRAQTAECKFCKDLPRGNCLRRNACPPRFGDNLPRSLWDVLGEALSSLGALQSVGSPEAGRGNPGLAGSRAGPGSRDKGARLNSSADWKAAECNFYRLTLEGEGTAPWEIIDRRAHLRPIQICLGNTVVVYAGRRRLGWGQHFALIPGRLNTRGR